MATTVQETVSRDQVIWSFAPDLEPVLEVEPGAVVKLETNDCFTGQIRTEDDLVTGIDFERINSATGPIAVTGAEPGDSLVVELLEVNPIEWGVATIIPGYGQLHEQVRSPVTKIFSVKDGWIEMDERIRFPVRPMVGVVGRSDRERHAHECAARPARRQPRQPPARPGGEDLLPRAPAGRDVRGRRHARVDGRRRDLRHRRRDRRGGRRPVRPREGQAGPLAGHRARPTAGSSTERRSSSWTRCSSPARRPPACSSTSGA